MTDKSRWAAGLALGGARFAALLLAAMLPALFDHGYRLLDAEVLVIGAGAAGVGLLLSLATRKAQWLGRLLFAALVVLVLDVYFLSGWLLVLAVAAVAIGVQFTRFESECSNIAAVFALIFIALAAQSSYRSVLKPMLPAAPRPMASGAVSGKPLVLHIVLDEQGSPLAASAAMQSSGRLDRLLESYVQRGFHIQTSVRAISGATQISLGRVFGPQDLKPHQKNVSSVSEPFTNRLRENDLLQQLDRQGFDVTVIQNMFLQLCPSKIGRCHTYQRANHGHAMRRFNDRLGTRLWLAGALLHTDFLDTQGDRGAYLYRFPARLAMRHGIGYSVEKSHFWTRPATVLEVLDNLEHQVPDMQPGEAWMIHLLLPHFPYVLDSQCGLRSHKDWSVPAWVSETTAEEALMARLEQDYWQQAECVHARLLGIIDQLDQKLGREHVRILIHGDHGARLAQKEPEPEATVLAAGDHNGSLDTLMLLRAPAAAPGVTEDRISLVESVRRSYGLLLQ